MKGVVGKHHKFGTTLKNFLIRKVNKRENAIIALKYFLALVSMGLLIYGHI